MSIKPTTYTRKAFEVKAIEVTPENIHEVAEWCGGEVRRSNLDRPGGRDGFQEYIKVAVKRPQSDRQTRAYAGDWVLLATSEGADTGPAGFKVYTPKAFVTSFDKQVETMIDVVQRMDARAKAEERAETQEETLFSDPSRV